MDGGEVQEGARAAEGARDALFARRPDGRAPRARGRVRAPRGGRHRAHHVPRRADALERRRRAPRRARREEGRSRRPLRAQPPRLADRVLRHRARRRAPPCRSTPRWIPRSSRTSFARARRASSCGTRRSRTACKAALAAQLADAHHASPRGRHAGDGTRRRSRVARASRASTCSKTTSRASSTRAARPASRRA